MEGNPGSNQNGSVNERNADNSHLGFGGLAGESVSVFLQKCQDVGAAEPHLQLLSNCLIADASATTFQELSKDQIQFQSVKFEDGRLKDPKECWICNCRTSELSKGELSCQIFHVDLERLIRGVVKIEDVLTTLYHSNCVAISSELQSAVKNDEPAMCLPCISKLTKLFELHNEFLSISARSNSVLAKLCRAVLQTIQTRIKIKFTKNSKDVLQKKSTVELQRCPDVRFTSSEPQGLGTINASPRKDISKTVSLDGNGDAICNRCGKRFKSMGGLKIHFASHVRDDHKVTCKVCGKRFSKQKALDMHEEIDHKGFKPHKCPHDGCERSFRLKDKLKIHIKVVHDKKKPFPCPKCDKAFRTKYHLKAHDVVVHVQGDSTLGCSQCRRKFPSKTALEEHVKRHQSEKPFKCSVCPKGFNTLSRLKCHEKSHEALPTAVCAICGKAYRHARDLRLHEAVHEEESSYRFACGNCPRRFYRIDLLRVHQANEQHFSQEIVGPSTSKLSQPSTKLNHKQDERSSKKSDNTDDTSRTKGKTKSSIRKRNTNSKFETTTTTLSSTVYDCLGDSPSIFPDDSSLGMEIVELTPSLTTDTSILNHKDSANPSLLTSNDAELQNMALVPSSYQYSLQTTATATRDNTSLKDTSDKNIGAGVCISAFNISAGAEQIGYDVINAFINNLSRE